MARRIDLSRRAGIPCPKCGCRHWLTQHTRQVGDRIRRDRECRNCGETVVTFEQLSDVPPPEKREPPVEQNGTSANNVSLDALLGGKTAYLSGDGTHRRET